MSNVLIWWCLFFQPLAIIQPLFQLNPLDPPFLSHPLLLGPPGQRACVGLLHLFLGFCSDLSDVTQEHRGHFFLQLAKEKLRAPRISWRCKTSMEAMPSSRMHRSSPRMSGVKPWGHGSCPSPGEDWTRPLWICTPRGLPVQTPMSVTSESRFLNQEV